MTHQTDFDAVVEALRGHDRFVVVTHENPDGDALGSMLGAALGLRALGKDVVMYLRGHDAVPGRVRLHAALRGASRAPVGFRRARAARRRLRERAEDRPGARPARAGAARRRRRPPPRQHPFRLGQPRRRRRIVDGGDRPRPPRRARRHRSRRRSPRPCTWVSSRTPDGSSTRTRPRRRCGWLPSWSRPAPTSTKIFKHVYETVQFAKLKLLGSALDRAQAYEGGRLVVSYLLRTDFADVGAEEPFSEGIIDFLRADRGGTARRADPRAADAGRADAPYLAPLQHRRARRLGDRPEVGGRRPRQAAGFSSEQLGRGDRGVRPP